MKRFTLLFLVLFCTGSLFAAAQKEKKPLDLGLGVNYTLLSESGKFLDSNVTSYYSSYGVHFSMAGMIGENWGAVDNIGLYFPFAATSEIDGVRTDVDMSTYDYLFGMNIILGFPYYFIKEDQIRIGIGPAFDYLSFFGGTRYISGVGFYGGLGIVLDGRYSIGESSFFNFGLFALNNFYQSSFISTAYESYSVSGFTNSIVFKPYIGVGYTINSKPK